MADTRLAVDIAVIAGGCVALWMLVASRHRKPAKREEWRPVNYDWRCIEELPCGDKRWELVEEQRNLYAVDDYRTVRVGWNDVLRREGLHEICRVKPFEVSSIRRLRTARG